MENITNDEQRLAAEQSEAPDVELPEMFDAQSEAPNTGDPEAVVADTKEDAQEQKEEIKFQRIMNYKAYRRGMVMFRLAIAAALAVGLAFTGMISIFFGITLPVLVFIITAITILYSLGNEQTYNVYTERVVLKRRGDYGRKSVPFDNIVSVEYKSAFYEKRMCVETVTIKAKDDKGKIKKYKMKHILDAKPIVQYINQSINRRKTDGGQD